jgi:MFS family permease
VAQPVEATDTSAPERMLTHRQIVTILIGLMLGMFLAALDQTVVATAMRTIADDLSGFSLQAWATTAFLITSTISTPLYGKLSDIYGRKPFFLFAIAVFIAGSALCGLAQSMYQLAGARALQGVGAGGLMSLALAIIGDLVAPRERARYQGYFLAVFGSASVLGPIIGGFFAGAGTILGVEGWRWIFYINVPIAFAAFLVVNRVLHIPHTRQDHRIDWPGAVALVICLVPLLVVAEQGREWGWSSPRSLTCYLLGLVGLILFLLAEWRYGDEALLPLRLFRGRTFAGQHVDQLHPRYGHVRRVAAASAVSADREERQPDQGRPRADPAGGRHHGRLHPGRSVHLPDRPLPDLPDRRHRADAGRPDACSRGSPRHAAVAHDAGDGR